MVPLNSVLLLMSLLNAANVQTTELKCSIASKNFKVIGNVTICNVINKVKINSENEVAVFPDQNDTTAQGVLIENQEVLYLPHFYGTMMTNFRVLGVVNSKLQKISSLSLLGMRSLEYLDVSMNEIEYIPGNLFQFSSAIKVAIFDQNNIKAIGTNAFKTLQYLGLQNVTCYSGTAQAEVAISATIKEVKQKCLSFSEDYFSNDFIRIEGLGALKDNYDQLHNDIKTIKILTSIILAIILLAALIFILYLLRTEIHKGFLAIYEKIWTRNNDTEIIIEETSSINYASCIQINETFSESINNIETSAIYDSVYVESAAVEDEKVKVIGIRNITPNSTNYASVEETLTHLDQESIKLETKTLENGIIWEKSKLFEDKSDENLTLEVPERNLQNQQSHKLGSESTNAMYEHESLYRGNVTEIPQNQSNLAQKSKYLIKSEQNATQNLSNSEHVSSTLPSSDMTSQASTSITSTPVQESSNLINSEQNSLITRFYDMPSRPILNLDQNASNSTQASSSSDHSSTVSDTKTLTRQYSNSSITDQKSQKSSYKTKIPQSMNPKALNLANIDEKITHFEQTSPVFADVAQKLMNSSVGGEKAVNHFGFRSLTYADVGQKTAGPTDSSLKPQNINSIDPKSPNVKDLAKKFSNMENSGPTSPIENTNPFLQQSEASNENDDYAEPFYRTTKEAEEQNASEYAEPYQSKDI
ncbi:unnamed protein product [Chironomus riparius]|uniref:Uncharacterized protein n=1 Tax=Chironomus riparius TaxID=315576 RepID=A0A9P0JAV2_9DIPT|nr:unnamed protein product [Chironomus riparius]